MSTETALWTLKVTLCGRSHCGIHLPLPRGAFQVSIPPHSSPRSGLKCGGGRAVGFWKCLFQPFLPTSLPSTHDSQPALCLHLDAPWNTWSSGPCLPTLRRGSLPPPPPLPVHRRLCPGNKMSHQKKRGLVGRWDAGQIHGVQIQDRFLGITWPSPVSYLPEVPVCTPGKSGER